jgi:peptidylprolyl isomerase
MLKFTGPALLVAAACLLQAACTETSAQDKKDEKEVKTESGLRYVDLKEGTGEAAKKGDTVEVHYTGWLYNDGKVGKKFDSSVDRGKPFTFTIGGRVIKGWNEGVVGMKVGGKRKLIIPPDLGYGKEGAGEDIPPNATLLFEVELLKIK